MIRHLNKLSLPDLRILVLLSLTNYKPLSQVELETKVIRRFVKVSIVCYSRPSLVIIASVSQFHVYLPWGQRPFTIVS